MECAQGEDDMDLSTFHNVLEHDYYSTESFEQESEELRLDEPEKVMETLFTTMHVFNKPCKENQFNLRSFLENSATEPILKFS